MSTFNKSWRRGVVALAVTAALGLCSTAVLAAGEGIVGTIEVGSGSISDYSVSIKNPQTGYSREIQLTDSSFRFTQLPVGEYEVTVSKNGTVVAKDTVRVSLGANAVASFDLNTSGAETIEVVGARPSAVDLTTSDSGLVLGETEFDAMPVARNLTAVALLAPGTVQGESRFGNLASFGGSSVAENSCFINGLEVTDTRQGLGCGSVPFEFYKEFQVKTGGYSAQFGRTTGGVINAVTKSGTNEWDFAATYSTRPDSLRESGQVSYSTMNNGAYDNAVFRDTTGDEADFSEFTLSAAGPLIQDKLFVYAIINPRNSESWFVGGGGSTSPDNRRYHDKSSGADNMFWGTKIDWDITEDHRVSVFAYSNRSDTEREVYRYNAQTGEQSFVAASGGPDGLLLERGGEATSITYTGHLTDDLTLSVLSGEIESQYYSDPSNKICPSITDSRTTDVSTRVGGLVLACGPGTATGENFDNTKQQRVDLEWVIGDHIVHGGLDFQTRDSANKTYPIKGAFGTNGTFTYNTLAADPDGAGPLRGGSLRGLAGGTFYNDSATPLDIVRNRIFETTAGGGEFTSDMEALYIEDTWQVNGDLSVSVGVRSDSLTNYGSSGKAFADFQDQVAPRLGATWDPTGEGKSKVYFTWGRYFLPIPNNTNYRMASGIYDATTNYTFTGVNTDGTPTGITPVGGRTVAGATSTNSAGDVYPGTDLTQTKEAKPFYKEETILGYESELSEELTGSVRAMYRDTASALDDYCGDLAPWCVLLNPGEGQSWAEDFDFDGVADGPVVYHSAEEIGLPKAHNEYYALQFQLDHRSADLRWSFLYTWSRSFGNFEGSVKSDIAQADAGITQDFDFPALMDGSEGYQPNDRRHVFKFYGNYKVTDAWSVGWNSALSDGRPLSRFGNSYPVDDEHIYGSYGDTFYTSVGGNYEFLSRGKAGRTPWTFNLDVSMDYSFNVNGVDMKAKLDVFNVLNIQEVTASNEDYEITAGTRNPYYGSPTVWQAPRSVALTFEARF